VCQRARDQDGPRIDHQLLIYPVVTPDFDTASYQEFGEGHFLTRQTMRSFWSLYVGAGDAPPYADLYAAGTLAGLPPATVFTCDLDVLRDEGTEYARRLSAAGVAVTHTHVAGLIHGIWYMDAIGDRAYQFGLDIAAALRRVTTPKPS
jgi:acetyl esterase